MNWILAEVSAKDNTYTKIYTEVSKVATSKATFDAKITADATNYSTTSTKYVIGAVLAAADYDTRLGLGTELVTYGYTIGDHVQHFLNAATLKKIATQTKTKATATNVTSAEATVMASINSALISNGAFNSTNVASSGKTYTFVNAFWQLYFNTKLDEWTTLAKRTAIASPKIVTAGKGRFVTKKTDGSVDYVKSGLLIQSYLADTATKAFDVIMANDWTEAEFETLFNLVATVEDRYAVIDTRILLDNKVFTADQLKLMTFRRQAFEVALYESTYTGEAGYTAAQFKEYALDVELRNKYMDEKRLTD